MSTKYTVTKDILSAYRAINPAAIKVLKYYCGIPTRTYKPHSEIAKEIGLKAETIRYCAKVLHKLGLIRIPRSKANRWIWALVTVTNKGMALDRIT